MFEMAIERSMLNSEVLWRILAFTSYSAYLAADHPEDKDRLETEVKEIVWKCKYEFPIGLTGICLIRINFF